MTSDDVVKHEDYFDDLVDAHNRTVARVDALTEQVERVCERLGRVEDAMSPRKPSHWTVVDADGWSIERRGDFSAMTTNLNNAVAFPTVDGATALKEALEAGGMADLRVVEVVEDDRS